MKRGDQDRGTYLKLGDREWSGWRADAISYSIVGLFCCAVFAVGVFVGQQF